MSKLTKKERSEIAKEAVKSRKWRKHRPRSLYSKAVSQGLRSKAERSRIANKAVRNRKK